MPVWPWIVILAVVSFLGGVGTGWSLLVHLAYALAALVLVALALVASGRRGLRATSSVNRTRITAGDAIVEMCRLEKQSILPAAWLEVEWADGDRETLALPGGRTRSVTRESYFPHRGRYLAGGAHVGVRDPLGLVLSTGAFLPGVAVTVYPRPLAAPDAVGAVRALQSGRHRQPVGQADATAGDLRDYVPGDSLSRIHWRTTARRGILTVSDPESGQRPSVWLLVDLGGDDDAAEEAAGVATYVATALQGKGSRVGAIVAGQRLAVVSPRGSHDRVERVLGVLAEMPAAPESQEEELLQAAARLRDPGCFVVISRSRDVAWRDALPRLKQAHPRARVLLVVAQEAAA